MVQLKWENYSKGWLTLHLYVPDIWALIFGEDWAPG